MFSCFLHAGTHLPPYLPDDTICHWLMLQLAIFSQPLTQYQRYPVSSLSSTTSFQQIISSPFPPPRRSPFHEEQHFKDFIQNPSYKIIRLSGNGGYERIRCRWDGYQTFTATVKLSAPARFPVSNLSKPRPPAPALSCWPLHRTLPTRSFNLNRD